MDIYKMAVYVIHYRQHLFYLLKGARHHGLRVGLYHTRLYPSAMTIIFGLFGGILVLRGLPLLSGSMLGIGFLVGGLAALNWWMSEVSLTARYLTFRPGLFGSTTELQLAKLETIQTGMALGNNAKPVSVVGTGGTLYRLGTIPNAREFRERLQDAIDQAQTR